MNKFTYWVLAALALIVTIGVIVSTCIRQQAFTTEDALTLVASIAGWLCTNKDASSTKKSKDDASEDENEQEKDNK